MRREDCLYTHVEGKIFFCKDRVEVTGRNEVTVGIGGWQWCGDGY